MQLLQKSGIQMNAWETSIKGILSQPIKSMIFTLLKEKSACSF